MHLLGETDFSAPHSLELGPFCQVQISEAIWKRDVYDGLVDVLGIVTITGIARRFYENLATRFVDHADRTMLRRDAHAIVASAGMLGFAVLSDAAHALEQSCLNEEDLERPLAALLSARRATQQCLSGLLHDDVSAVPDPR